MQWGRWFLGECFIFLSSKFFFQYEEAFAEKDLDRLSKKYPEQCLVVKWLW